MKRLNKNELLQHQMIFLAPGSYLHQEHSNINYAAMPSILQQAHNKRLLLRYSLLLPSEQTLALPNIIARQWLEIRNVAWYLGILLQPDPHQWWLQTPACINLIKSFSTHFYSRQERLSLTPQELLAAGAAQLLAYLSQFGEIYTQRCEYIFNRTTQQLIKITPPSPVLPWNIIKEVFLYATKNKTDC